MPASKILLTINADTKEEETEIVSQLLNRLQYSPASVTPSECPDFEIELHEKLIGVEVTKYYSDYSIKGSKTQQRISEWKKFAENLKTKLSTIKSDFIFLYGSINFHNNNVNYRDLLKDDYFNELVNLLISIGLERTEQRTVEISEDSFPLLSSHISSIFLWDTYPENIYLWWDSNLQSGKVINNELAIQLIVEKKEELSKKYKQNYFQKWLVIYAGGLGLHDMFTNTTQNTTRQGAVFLTELSNSQQGIPIDIKSDYFTHIFIWDKFTEKIFQLFPYFKKIVDGGEMKIYVNHLPLKE
jgi:hypothetical protein